MDQHAYTEAARSRKDLRAYVITEISRGITVPLHNHLFRTISEDTSSFLLIGVRLYSRRTTRQHSYVTNHTH